MGVGLGVVPENIQTILVKTNSCMAMWLPPSPPKYKGLHQVPLYFGGVGLVDERTGSDKIAGAILDARSAPVGRGPGWPESIPPSPPCKNKKPPSFGGFLFLRSRLCGRTHRVRQKSRSDFWTSRPSRGGPRPTAFMVDHSHSSWGTLGHLRTVGGGSSLGYRPSLTLSVRKSPTRTLFQGAR